MKNNTKSKPNMKKEDFINFLATSSPEEINKYIKEKGKPRKLISPIYFYGEEDKKK